MLEKFQLKLQWLNDCSTSYLLCMQMYWLYAAVNGNCLLVTNDEMRDHLFQLLGTSFFPRWKEKHQVLHPPNFV
ncbi:Proteinaceous RNase P 1, chloroplastic/mitochondrial [Vitis vinifera]|uniref:Proteinaceous RNase P 1, chloroplastic/mitochondrial n=1 Tax=Vitis vinifera TaxID=29760 RepID=A0A438IC68_VITVI|nr:Proteinaceous RNase P 1, chloroplastic/mitochondrial [Vitis vinifera]